MPYVDCIRCGLTAFTASVMGPPDRCERCGTELPQPHGSHASHHGFLGLRSPESGVERWRADRDGVASATDGEVPL